jgi:E3 ubiquitin-protein ligase SIAH1
MEKLSCIVKLPCKYSTYGCAVSLLYPERKKHEETCEFLPYYCPYADGCGQWQGLLDQIVPHLMMFHKSIATVKGEDIVIRARGINQPGECLWVNILSCFGHNFSLLLDKRVKCNGCEHFYVIVQLFGTRNQAENFEYRLELKRQRRCVTWEATPRSIHEKVATIITNSDCLGFEARTAQLFADDGYLCIRVSISVVCDTGLLWS